MHALNVGSIVGEKAFLALPRRGALCDGHCLIMPVTNSSCSTKACDEDVFAEVTRFKQQLQVSIMRASKCIEMYVNLSHAWFLMET